MTVSIMSVINHREKSNSPSEMQKKGFVCTFLFCPGVKELLMLWARESLQWIISINHVRERWETKTDDLILKWQSHFPTKHSLFVHHSGLASLVLYLWGISNDMLFFNSMSLHGYSTNLGNNKSILPMSCLSH